MSSEFEFGLGFRVSSTEKIGTFDTLTVCIPGTFSTCTTIYSEVPGTQITASIYFTVTFITSMTDVTNSQIQVHLVTLIAVKGSNQYGINTVQTRVLLLLILFIVIVMC